MKIICIDTELGADHFNVFFMTKNLILKKKIRKKLNNYKRFTKNIYRIYNFLQDFCCYGNLICKSIQCSIHLFINDMSRLTLTAV